MKTLIIGGGLSGLAIAHALENEGRDYQILEARPQFGGRILTHHLGAGYFDMGPAWFWPGQPRIAALLRQLNLQKFDQFSDGLLSYENEHGQVQRDRGFSSMQGSWRVAGGLSAVTNALAAEIPDHRKRLDAAVAKLTLDKDRICATLANGDDIHGDQVVLALPPRVAALIGFAPALPRSVLQEMQRIPTWMAGQAKAVAVYDTPFWRDSGLSGDAMSRKGPMVEIHDASPAEGGPYGLFGFIGVPHEGRTHKSQLMDHIKAQLIRLFGPQAANPIQIYIKDWAVDRHTATEADKAPLYAHPSYGLPQAMTGVWHQNLHFAGTEVAPTFGGYIEGALEAAENALYRLK